MTKSPFVKTDPKRPHSSAKSMRVAGQSIHQRCIICTKYILSRSVHRYHAHCLFTTLLSPAYGTKRDRRHCSSECSRALCQKVPTWHRQSNSPRKRVTNRPAQLPSMVHARTLTKSLETPVNLEGRQRRGGRGRMRCDGHHDRGFSIVGIKATGILVLPKICTVVCPSCLYPISVHFFFTNFKPGRGRSMIRCAACRWSRGNSRFDPRSRTRQGSRKSSWPRPPD